MRRGLGVDRGRGIIERARQAILRGERRETGLQAGEATGDLQGTPAPIHDEDGVLYFMCGVSECGGPDRCGP